MKVDFGHCVTNSCANYFASFFFKKTDSLCKKKKSFEAIHYICFIANSKIVAHFTLTVIFDKKIRFGHEISIFKQKSYKFSISTKLAVLRKQLLS